MTAAIAALSGPEAYDLIYHDHLAMLPSMDQETMQRAMQSSTKCWVGYDSEGGQVLGCWGLIAPTLLSDRAYLWMYVTEHMQHHPFLLIRYSQRMIGEMLKTYPTIIGHTEVDNHRAIRWLRWLGAVFGEPIDGKVFPFEIRAAS